MDLKEIKELIEVFDNSSANILEYENEEFRIYLDKSATAVQNVSPEPIINTPATPTVTINKTTQNTNQCEEGEIIASPMVGTFYQAPSPDSPPYVKIGDKVKKGQTLCIIEAMKIMNELEAEFECEILEVLVEDGEPVEFDTPLFMVKRI